MHGIFVSEEMFDWKRFVFFFFWRENKFTRYRLKFCMTKIENQTRHHIDIANMMAASVFFGLGHTYKRKHYTFYHILPSYIYIYGIRWWCPTARFCCVFEHVHQHGIWMSPFSNSKAKHFESNNYFWCAKYKRHNE